MLSLNLDNHRDTGHSELLHQYNQCLCICDGNSNMHIVAFQMLSEDASVAASYSSDTLFFMSISLLYAII